MLPIEQARLKQSARMSDGRDLFNRVPRPLRMFFGAFAGVAAVFYLAFVPWLQLLAGLHPGQNPLILLWVWLLAGQALFVSQIAMKAATLARHDAARARPRLVLTYIAATFAISVSGTLGGFAETYYVLFGASTADFDPALTPMRAAFFTWGNFTTAGSGITATSAGAQALTIVQMAVSGFLVLVALAYIVANLRFASWAERTVASKVEPSASAAPTSSDASPDP